LYFHYTDKKQLSVSDIAWNAHNIFLDLAASMGLLGLVGFCFIFCPTFKPLTRKEKSLKRSQTLLPWKWIWVPMAIGWVLVALIQSPLEAHNALSVGVVFAAFLLARSYSR